MRVCNLDHSLMATQISTAPHVQFRRPFAVRAAIVSPRSIWGPARSLATKHLALRTVSIELRGLRGPPRSVRRRVWRSDADSNEDAESWNDEAMQDDIRRLTKKRALEKLQATSYREKFGEAAEGPRSSLGGVLDKLLVADFFLILAVLAWFLAGVAQRTALGDDGILEAWLPLWTPLFQPALGVFMAGALLSAVAKWTGGNK